jgi:hypothetical protein
MSQSPAAMSVVVIVPTGVTKVPIKRFDTSVWFPEGIVVCAPTFGVRRSVPV